MSSLEKCLFRSSAHLKIWFIFCCCVSSLDILDTNPLSKLWFANIFSHSVGCLFILFMVSFAVQKLLSLTRWHLFIFAFVSLAWGDIKKKYWYNLCQRVFCLCFLLGVSWFQVLYLGLFLFFFKNQFYLFIYFWLCWVFVAVCKLSLVVESRGYSLLRCAGFSLRWLLLLRSTGSRRTGFSSCGTLVQ